MKEALYYESYENYALCLLCPHRCHITPGSSGLCFARENVRGRLYARSYGRLTVMSPDAIELKPLRRFLPGSKTLSIGSYGCNLACPYCQNADIAKGRPDYAEVPPQAVVEKALAARLPSVSYTYNEPVISLEYVTDCSKLAHANGIKNVLVTNGYIEPEPFSYLLRFTDAANIDLKAWNEVAYNRIGGSLSPVADNIRMAAGRIHLEVTMPLVPGLNCNMQEIADAAKFLASVDPGIPFHLLRYFPAYNYLKPATDPEFVRAAAAVAKKYLKYVYVGNL